MVLTGGKYNDLFACHNNATYHLNGYFYMPLLDVGLKKSRYSLFLAATADAVEIFVVGHTLSAYKKSINAKHKDGSIDGQGGNSFVEDGSTFGLNGSCYWLNGNIFGLGGSSFGLNGRCFGLGGSCFGLGGRCDSIYG
jgi:hypothetical protein